MYRAMVGASRSLCLDTFGFDLQSSYWDYSLFSFFTWLSYSFFSVPLAWIEASHPSYNLEVINLDSKHKPSTWGLTWSSVNSPDELFLSSCSSKDPLIRQVFNLPRHIWLSPSGTPSFLNVSIEYFGVAFHLPVTKATV